MKLCRRCNAQFSDEHRRCVHCGGRLGPLEESPSTPTAPSASEGPDLSALHHLTDDHPSKIAPLLERGARVASGPASGDLCPACHDPLPRAAEACPSCGLAFPDG